MSPLAIACIFLSLFYIQYYYNLSPKWLNELQDINAYKQITGFILAIYILNQWQIAFTRNNGQKPSAGQRYTHRYSGSFVPIVYYFHSVDIGFAYQAILSMSLLLNCVIGGCNPTDLKIRYVGYYRCWLTLHISLAVIIVPVSLYHLYIVYAY
ncbi:MAG: hypothetical protein ACC707_03220 [Thiohalomonadales bacterium]